MPKVSEYGGPKVREQGGNARLSVSANASQFGANVGNAVSNLAGVVNANAQAMKEKDDNAKIKAATVELRRSINARTHLDEDAYYSRKGINAYDTYEPMKAELLDIRKTIGETLESGRQQDAFQALSEQYLVSEEESMSRYSAGERVGWLNEQDQAIVTQSQEDGSLRWVDNSVYQNNIEKSIDTLAERNGWPPEKVEVEKSTAVSSMHVSAIERVLSESPEAAETYFESHKDSIDKGLHVDIENKIKTHNDGIWVMAEADRIRATSESLGERLDDARDVAGDDPDRRKLLISQVESEYRQGKAAETEAKAGAYQSARLALVDPDNPQSVAQMKTTPMWKAMGDGFQADIIISELNMEDRAEAAERQEAAWDRQDKALVASESYGKIALDLTNNKSIDDIKSSDEWDDLEDSQKASVIASYEARVSQDSRQTLADIKAGQDQAFGMAKLWLADNPSMGRNAFQVEYPIQYLTMTDDQKVKLHDFEEKRDKGVKTDPNKVNELVGILHSGKPDAVNRALNFHAENTMYFDDAKSMSLYSDIVKFKTPSGNDVSMVETDKAQFNRWFDDFVKDGDDQLETVMMGIYQNGLSQWREENDGKKVVPFDVRTRILDQMAIEKTKIDGGLAWFDKDYNIGEIPSKDLKVITTNLNSLGIPLTPKNILGSYTITDNERQEVIEALESAGREINERNIIKLYAGG